MVAKQNARFTASAIGIEKEKFSYQWRHNGSDIYGATADTLNITNTVASQGGRYECIVTNEHGNSSSSSAVLIVIS